MTRGSLLSPELRSSARSRIEPFAELFGRVGVTPNTLTLIGLGVAGVAGIAAANQAWFVAGLLVVFGGLFDLFDGALARATGTTSKFGAFLDSTLDRAGEAVIYLGIIVGLGSVETTYGPLLAAAAMAAAFMVSYSRAKSESLGYTPGSGMANVGLAPREVRIAILTLGLLIAGLLHSASALLAALGFITILAIITAIQRILVVRAQAVSQEQSEVNR